MKKLWAALAVLLLTGCMAAGPGSVEASRDWPSGPDAPSSGST